MIDDTAIREAFGTIAGEAHAPERIRGSLAARVRRHRQRRLLLRVAGAGAAVAVTGLGVRQLTVRPDPVPFPDVAGGPGGGWRTVPLLFRPAWLPAGYGQSALTMVVAGDDVPVVTRDWQPAPRGDELPGAVVQLLVGWHASLDANRPQGRTRTADVGGVTAQMVENGGVYVTWQPAGAPQLLVSALSDGDPGALREIALRVARSVRPDARRVAVGPRFGWLPEDLAGRPWHLHVGHDGSDWRQDVTIANALTMLMGPHLHRPVDRTDAVTVPVRGAEEAWHPRHGGQLLLTRPDGVDVFVQRDGDPTGPLRDLVHIAEGFDFGPWPDMSWVGSR